jgi:type IV secretory pathway VirB2 component (pilin)
LNRTPLKTHYVKGYKMLASASKNKALTHWSCLAVCLAAAVILLAPSMAHAANYWTPMGFVLCQIAGFFYGNLGRGLSTLAIIVVGVGATLGKVSWGLAVTVAVGIAVMGGANDILTLLGANFEACT